MNNFTRIMKKKWTRVGLCITAGIFQGCFQNPETKDSKRTTMRNTSEDKITIERNPSRNRDRDDKNSEGNDANMDADAIATETYPQVDFKEIDELLSASMECAKENLGLTQVPSCLQEDSYEVINVNLYQLNLLEESIEVEAMLLEEASKVTTLGLAVYGLPANSNFRGYLANGACNSAAMSESTNYEPFQKIEGDSSPVSSQLNLDFATDATGNSLVFSAANFTIPYTQEVSIVFVMSDPAEMAEMAETSEGMMEPICLDNTSLVDVMIHERERERDKRQKKDPIEIIALELPLDRVIFMSPAFLIRSSWAMDSF